MVKALDGIPTAESVLQPEEEPVLGHNFKPLQLPDNAICSISLLSPVQV
jgi:hypothetical protein